MVSNCYGKISRQDGKTTTTTTTTKNKKLQQQNRQIMTKITKHPFLKSFSFFLFFRQMLGQFLQGFPGPVNNPREYLYTL